MKSTSLVWRAKTENGWKFFSVVVGRNGRVRKGVVLVDGEERNYPEGYFAIRYYEGRQTKYKNVGANATEATNECDRAEALAEAKSHAAEAGVTVNEPQQRKAIKAEATRFAKDALNRDALEAAKVNASALKEFQQANPRLTYVDEIDAEAMMTFRQYLKRKGNGPRTISNKYQRLTGFLKFCRIDYRDWRMTPPKFEKKIPNMYSEEEVELLLAACKRDYHRVLIHLLVETGLRDGEVQHLEWNDISLAGKKLKITSKPEYKWKIKDSEEREIPLSDNLIDILKKWRQANPRDVLVLPTTNGNPNDKLLRVLGYIAVRAGIMNATLHRFRRTYATKLHRGGVDPTTLRVLMGHSDLATTMRYLTPATDESVREKINEIF